MRFIKNSPALFIEEESILVIGDLHIGLSYKLSKKGINIPNQLPEIEKRLLKLLKKTQSKTVVMLGDIKEEVPGINYPEMIDIPEFLKRLSIKVDVHICQGNHDTHLEKVVPNQINLHSSGGFKINNYFFYHGHEWPSEEFLNCDYLILSHVHPVFEFKDKMDYRLSKPVWLKLKTDKENFTERYEIKKSGKIQIILLPAFNSLLGGYPINRMDKQMESISPIFRSNDLNMGEAEIYLLEGTYLGKLKDLL
jgi:hypothetical protein